MQQSQLQVPVSATADDAILSKLSCVRLKYYEDKYLETLLSNKKKVRRAPIINRGYYVRVAAFDKIITDFLQLNLCKNGSPKQIISLGAGIDTTFWRLSNSHPHLFKANNLSKFIEIDMFKTCSRKLRLLTQHEELFLNEAICGSKPQIDIKCASVLSEKYALIPGDLTKWSDIMHSLNAHKLINYDFPTLFISECVLIYIPWQKSEIIIQETAKLFKNGCAFSLYEQILPNDAFGQQMIKNLAERQLKLMSYEKYPTLEEQQNRFLQHGWDISVAWDLNRVYVNFLDKAELKRIEGIEMFDEYEEWHIFMMHYCISSSIKFPNYVKNRAAPKFSHLKAKTNDHEEEGKDNDDNLETDVLRENWCKFGFIHQHYNPKPLVVPTNKVM